MKNIRNFLTAAAILISISAIAQTPQAFKYQTVVRDAAGETIQNQNVSLRFNIHDVDATGVVVYSETHTVMTNQFGLANMEIGTGVPVSGTFSAIDWGTNSKYLEVELDPAGGSSFTSMGTTQLLSVPYSLYSENTANIDDADADPANELQTLSIAGNNLSISDGNTVTLPGSGINNKISDDDGNTWIDTEINSNSDSIVFYTMGMERMVISHNGYIYMNAQVSAVGFTGDGSGLTGVPGDDLGDHTATEDLDMANNRITNLVSPTTDTEAASKLYVDTQISLSGDNLGDHTATQNIQLDSSWLSNDGDNQGIYVDTAGNVGINTNTPSKALSVDGDIQSDEKIISSFGTANDAAYRFGAGFENSGLSSPYVNSVAVVTDGEPRIVIRNTGNVGIGITSPQEALHVAGSIMMVDGNEADGRVMISDADGTAIWTDPAILGDDDWTVSGDDMNSNVSGNVGIGTTTPGATLDVAGHIWQTGTGGSVFIGEGAGENDYFSNNHNIALGTAALYNNTTKDGLVAIGDSALYNNGIGATEPLHSIKNTAVGSKALYSNTIGGGNTANGYQSLYNNTTGWDNTANGVFALFNNTTGARNNANGVRSLYDNTTGFRNIANGFASLRNNTTGHDNTANGVYSLYTNTTGNYNNANGSFSLNHNTTGSSNVANGRMALYSNETGYSNVGVGVGALYSNTDKSNLVAIGDSALFNNGTDAIGNFAMWNTALGSKALFTNTIGTRNTATGYESLYSNTTGWSNTASGVYSLFNNETGNSNTATGNKSLYSNTTGWSNTASGVYSLFNNETGNKNTATGNNSLCSNTTGGSNTATGCESLYANTTGVNNTATGYSSLYANTVGNANSAYGKFALQFNETGSSNSALGYGAFSSGSSYDNSTGLGFDAEPGASNTIRLGNSSVSTIGGYANWTNVSDGRFKTEVKEDVAGLDFILKLRPVTYRLDMDAIAQFHKTPDSLRLPASEALKAEELQSGFIAQEVEKVANSLGYDFHGVDKPKNKNSSYGLRYAEFVVPLVKGMQEQQKMIEKQQEMIKELQAEIEKLKTK